MNTYTWFKIFNRVDFEALGLVSQDISIELEGKGQKDFLVTKGNLVGLTYDPLVLGIYLPLDLNDKNPFEFEDYAIYENTETNDVYFGFLVPE